MSEFFNLKRGCRQGDPISPYICILCAEILEKMVRENEIITGIKINGKEFRLSQYADDTKLFLDGKEQSLKETLNVFKIFYLMSGLKINVEKTSAIWIGSLSHSTRQLCKEYKLDWSQGSFRILGVTFTAEVFDIWNINTLFLALPNPPGELVNNLEKIFYTILWNSGPDRIKRSVITKDVTVGGLRMITINTFIKDLHVSWLRRIIIQSDNAWMTECVKFEILILENY